MNRRREFEMGSSEIRSAINELSMVVKARPAAAADTAVVEQQLTNSAAEARIPTKAFLSVCSLLLHVLDKIGPTMAVFRQDIHQNIQRLETLHETEPSVYSNIVEILKREEIEGNAKKGQSCSKAFVWLTRTLDFAITLLQLLVEDFGRNLEQAVDESYNNTLKPWHGWISSTAYKVALKLLPDTEFFITILMAKDENQDLLKEEMRTLISLCIPVLEQNQSILKTYGLDRLKCA